MQDQTTHEGFRRWWEAAEDDRLHLHVHTVSPEHRSIGVHVGLSGPGLLSFSMTLTAADAATLAGVLQDAVREVLRDE